MLRYETWDNINVAIKDTGLTTYIAHSYGAGKFCAITYGAGPIYRTNDNWQTADSSWIYPLGTPNVIVGAGFKGTDTIIAYGAHWERQAPELLITGSTDEGRTWKDIYVADTLHVDPVFDPSCISPLDMNPVFLGGNAMNFNYLKISTDHGLSWKTDSVNFDTLLYVTHYNGITVTPEGHAIGAFTVGSGCVLARGDANLDGINSSPSVRGWASIYPNPASTVLHISSAPLPGSSYVIIDVLGRERLRQSVGITDVSTFDISTLPKGIYCVLYDHNNVRALVGRFIVLDP